MLLTAQRHYSKSPLITSLAQLNIYDKGVNDDLFSANIQKNLQS